MNTQQARSEFDYYEQLIQILCDRYGELDASQQFTDARLCHAMVHETVAQARRLDDQFDLLSVYYTT